MYTPMLLQYSGQFVLTVVSNCMETLHHAMLRVPEMILRRFASRCLLSDSGCNCWHSVIASLNLSKDLVFWDFTDANVLARDAYLA